MSNIDRETERKRLKKIERYNAKWFWIWFIILIAGISIYANESLIRDMLPNYIDPFTTTIIYATVFIGGTGIIVSCVKIYEVNEAQKRLGFKDEDDI